jgi:hypothetical protein
MIPTKVENIIWAEWKEIPYTTDIPLPTVATTEFRTTKTTLKDQDHFGVHTPERPNTEYDFLCVIYPTRFK